MWFRRSKWNWYMHRMVSLNHLYHNLINLTLSHHHHHHHHHHYYYYYYHSVQVFDYGVEREMRILEANMKQLTYKLPK